MESDINFASEHAAIESFDKLLKEAASNHIVRAAFLVELDRLQRIEAAAKVLTDAWQRGDHEQAVFDAVAKLTREVQTCDAPTT